MNARRLIIAVSLAALVGAATWLLATSSLGATPAGVRPAQDAPSGSAVQEADGFEWYWVINGPNGADGA